MFFYLAIDIGASSGRHIIGYMDSGEIKTVEVYRFKNGVFENNGHLFWNLESLLKEVKTGIKIALEKYPKIESLAIDTWGVDYILMKNDTIIGKPYAYRDSRTENTIPKVHDIIPFEELYNRTGIAFNTFNTIYQLYDDKEKGLLDEATDFLHIPEYLNYCLTGVKMKEYTMASTTGLINVNTKDYDSEIIEKLGFNKEIFKELHEGGDFVGNFKEEIVKELGGNIPVKLCLSHDTASAVYAIDYDCPYISSGTWSLLGVKEKYAHTDLNSMKCNFTNEGGINRTFRYLKNIMGMWVVNNISKENGITPIEFRANVANSTYKYTFDINSKELLAPKNMTEAVKAELKKVNAPEPRDLNDLANSVLLSLAKSYAESIKEIETNIQRKSESIVIVGGGAHNTILNKYTEELSGKKVISLPIEATAIGNLKIQMR